ncbi:MAG: DegQ family serine endoprotease [Lautropia sp.]
MNGIEQRSNATVTASPGGWRRSIAIIALVACGAFVGPLALSGQGAAWAQAGRELPDFADLVEKTGTSVVNIRTTERARSRSPSQGGPQMPDLDPNDPFYEFFRRFFPPGTVPGQPRGQTPPRSEPRGGQNQPEVPRGVGSGFFITSDGYLLTNHHVVDGADEIYVTMTDKREFKGKLIGSDQRTDVALVKVETSGVSPRKNGDIHRLRVGELVLAIGAPFGHENTVTAGNLSAQGRETGDYLPFIQTDVAVNPGNSGGPLLNMRGEVIGINSQIYSRTGGFMGISFAIPIDEAMRVADQLRTTGRVVRGRIGVGIAPVTKDVAEPLGLPRAAGALVRSVESGGPAEKAGIEVGDIIQRFDGRPIEQSSDLPRIVGNTKPTTQVPIEVWRRGQTRQLNVTVAELMPDRTASAADRSAPQPKPTARTNWLGIAASELRADKRNELRVKGGVVIDAVEESGPAAQAGLRQGDVLLQVNNQDIQSVEQFNAVVAKLDRQKPLVVLVRRGETAQYVPIKP